jgi:hypothetical protein
MQRGCGSVLCAVCCVLCDSDVYKCSGFYDALYCSMYDIPPRPSSIQEPQPNARIPHPFFSQEDGISVEPRFFIPILPTLLLNGTRGIGKREELLWRDSTCSALTVA